MIFPSKESSGSKLKLSKRYLIQVVQHNYKLKHDRADVIVHALKIYTTVMRWGQIDNIYVPKIGMADGLIKMLHKEIAVS